MNLREENYDRLHRIASVIPDSAIADTINAYRGTAFTGEQIQAIREFDAMAQKKMLLTKVHEDAFEELAEEARLQTEDADV